MCTPTNQSVVGVCSLNRTCDKPETLRVSVIFRDIVRFAIKQRGQAIQYFHGESNFWEVKTT